MARSSILLVIAFITAFSTRYSYGQEIQYWEDFALATDREAVLQKLIPGTPEYYFYHCLHYQNTQQFGKVERLLESWIKRYGRTHQVIEIQNRQALLTYGDSPRQSLDYLKTQIGLRFNHQREIPAEQRNLPSALDPKLVSAEALEKIARSQHRNTDGFETRALFDLASKSLNDTELRHMLQRLSRPDVPGLVKLIDRELRLRNSSGFGSMNIHRQLTLDQLEELVTLRPQTLNETNFINIYLSKLKPSDDVNLAIERNEHEAFLDRLWKFASRLAPVHNSLRANVLYHQLDLDRRQGNYDQEKFIEYLKLPRHAHYMNPKYIERFKRRQGIVNLGANYSGQTALAPIHNDESLIRDYFHHLLKDAAHTKEFSDYINDQYLKQRFAEAKIVNGIGDAEQWASALTPEQFRQLMERVDIDFALTNPTNFSVDQPVKLHVAIKNIDNLIVKIFEINARNYYRTHGREIDTTIQLDGLVPNHELKFSYSEPPLQRVERSFEFPQLDSAGVYVIDFIGNGQSSRALVRKGMLRYLTKTTVAGQLFSVINEKAEHVKEATINIGSRQFTPDEDGLILIPFSNRAGNQNIVINHGDLSSLDSFHHQSENYSLVAGIHVDRESLRQGAKAQVVVRPSLRLNGLPVDADVLKDVKLTVISTDHDGIQSRVEYDNLKISNQSDLVQQFQVPSRLNRLQFQLSAKVKNISRDRDESLAANHEVVVNEVDKQQVINDAYLVRTGKGYLITVKGKNGEARAKQVAQVTLKHRDFRREINATLQTDAKGAVSLGKLANIDWVRVVTGGQTRSWHLQSSRRSMYRSVHITEGEPVLIPLARFIGDSSRQLFDLFEMRSGQITRDLFSKIEIVDNVLVVKGLQRGDYQLLFKDSGNAVNIRVVKGQKQFGYTIGTKRTLENQQQDPVRIKDIRVDNDELQVAIGGVNESTRVHVLASHFVAGFDAYSAMSRVRGVEALQITNPYRPSAYIEGRDIGDEYRYILDRKYAAKYPGNMLTRPSLLLNPWAIRETQNNRENLDAGNAFGQGGGGRGGKSGRGESKREGSGQLVDPSSMDFLKFGSAIAWNLKPDKNGDIVIEQGALNGKHHIRLIIVDQNATVATDIAVKESEQELRDTRLTESIDSSNHFTLNKQISVVNPNEKIEISSLLASRMQTYDDLADVFEFYLAKTNNAHLKEFQFILRWPKLEDKEKNELYSKYACHELNVFLFHKDRAFYDSVIKPYLKNKKDPTFVDHFLTDASLTSYSNPWDHARLNVAERIFLGHRAHSSRIGRHLADLYALKPTPREVFDGLFDSAIAGKELDNRKRSIHRGAGPPQKNPAAPKPSAGAADFGGNAPGNRFDGKDRAGGTNKMRKGLDPKESFENRLGELESDRFADDEKSEIALAEESAKSLGKRRAKSKADADKSRDLQAYFKNLDEGKQNNGKFDKKASELRRLRQQVRQLYRRIENTKEWAENNYYHLPLNQQNESLITANRFWLDYANRDQSKSFLSVYFPEAHRNFSEMMFALAVLDLPFEADEHDYNFTDNTMTFTAKATAIVLHQQVQPAIFERRGSNVLVSENFFKNNDRYRYEENQRYDKFVNRDFVAGELYGSQIVITNPTSTPREIDLLIQIPQGAIPVNRSHQTRNLQLGLNAYSTQTFEYYFYFPETGEFDHYPAHVSTDKRVLAVAEPATFNVIDKPKSLDESSWVYVSQNGTNDEVIRYLNDNNVQRIDMNKIAFRMKDEGMYRRVINALSDRFKFDATLWSYSVYHNDADQIAQYLAHVPRIANGSGATLNSDILTIDPTHRRHYQHLEYMPLVNARSHQVGKNRKILNPQLYQQYHQLMRGLSYKNSLNASDRLAVTYYLLLQDRIGEAISMFESVSKNELSTSLQYDYCQAYVAMYQSNSSLAASIANRYQQFPVDRWRNAFAAITAQVKEIEGETTQVVDQSSRDQKQESLASTDSAFDLKVESRKVALQYQNTKQVTVNFYEMDIELLFSRNPFIDNYTQGFSMIKPNATQTIELPADQKEHSFELPENFHNSNVLVEVISGDQVKSQAYYAHSLTVQMSENYGHMKVGHQKSGKVLPKTYVKVYAQMNDGSVRFWKDGYTDLRGRFDYVSLSNQPLDNVARFSTLVLSDDHGAIVRAVTPPKE